MIRSGMTSHCLKAYFSKLHIWERWFHFLSHQMTTSEPLLTREHRLAHVVCDAVLLDAERNAPVHSSMRCTVSKTTRKRFCVCLDSLPLFLQFEIMCVSHLFRRSDVSLIRSSPNNT